ncbi:hypothetical protein ACWV95_36470 [Streptomyces albus]
MPVNEEPLRHRSAEMLKDPRYLRAVQMVDSEINRFRSGGGVAEGGPLTEEQTQTLALMYTTYHSPEDYVRRIMDSPDAAGVVRGMLGVAFAAGFQAGAKWSEAEQKQ